MMFWDIITMVSLYIYIIYIIEILIINEEKKISWKLLTGFWEYISVIITIKVPNNKELEKKNVFLLKNT